MRKRLVTWTESIVHEALITVPSGMSDADILDADDEDWYSLVQQGKECWQGVEHRQILSVDDNDNGNDNDNDNLPIEEAAPKLVAFTVNPWPAAIIAYAAVEGHSESLPYADAMRAPELDRFITDEHRPGDKLGYIESGEPREGCYLELYGKN